MKKITLLISLLLGGAMLVHADYGEVQFDLEESDSYAVGGIMTKVSNNGKYAVGYSDMTSAAFYYDADKDDLILLNPEIDQAVQAHVFLATASDVSDNGIIVGSYSFGELNTLPAYYDVATGQWNQLPLSPELEETYEGNANGEASSISSDGKYISGYINTRLDNSTLVKTRVLYTACLWVNKGTKEKPVYELQMPLETSSKRLVTQGDWAFQMSNDGKYIGGLHVNFSGCFNPAYWEYKGEGQMLERHMFEGMDNDSWDYENPEGTTDEEMGGAVAGQYWWDGRVTCISNSGEWIIGYTNYNGSGYIPESQADLPNPVGFKYNTVTKEMEDSLFGGMPMFVFDNGEIIYGEVMGMKTIYHSSDDKRMQSGARVEAVPGIGLMNMPYILLEGYVDNEIIEADLNINVFANNKTLYVDGEFSSIEIYTVLGAKVLSFENEISEINLSDLNNGVYLVRVINDGKFTTKKISL